MKIRCSFVIDVLGEVTAGEVGFIVKEQAGEAFRKAVSPLGGCSLPMLEVVTKDHRGRERTGAFVPPEVKLPG